MTSNELTARLLLDLPKRFPMRAIRRNVGMGYPIGPIGDAKRALFALDKRIQNDKSVPSYVKSTVKNALGMLHTRPVRFGMKGEPDIEGILGPNGRVVGIEVKAGKDRQRKEQQIAEIVIRKHGGIYIVAREVEAALEELAEEVGSQRTPDLGSIRGMAPNATDEPSEDWVAKHRQENWRE
jgi:hypothetical protein